MSHGTGSRTIAGINGTLELAAPLVPLFHLPSSAAGLATLPVPIPNNPILSGMTVYSQAWIHAPATGKSGTLSELVPIAIQ